MKMIAITCLVFYAGLCLLVGVFQRRMLYFPPAYSEGQMDQMATEANLARWTNATGQAIGLQRKSPRQPAQGRILVVYGNGNCAANCAHYADAIQQAGAFDVFIMEYPGYADRAGSPSQNSLFQAAAEAAERLPTNGPSYVVGESLGTGVAAYLVGTYPDRFAGAALLAPYPRLAAVAQYHMPAIPAYLLLIDRYPSQDYLERYHGPVAMMVAVQDRVIPAKFGRRLYEAYAGPKRLLEIPSVDHNELMDRSPEEWRQIIEFWQSRAGG